MKILHLAFFCLLCLTLTAQNKRGDRWMLSYCGCSPGHPHEDRFGGIWLNFEQDTALLSMFDIVTQASVAVANDEAGNLDSATFSNVPYRHF